MASPLLSPRDLLVSYVLCVGHLTRDYYQRGPCAGGGVFYGALTLLVCGAPDVRAVVAAGEEAGELGGFLALSERARVTHVHTPVTTTFRNSYDAHGARRQWVEAVAPPLAPDAVPGHWPAPMLAFLAPVLGELDLEHWLAALPQETFVVLTAQGWLRRLGERVPTHAAQWVEPAPWPWELELMRDRVGLVSLSVEDVRAEPGLAERLATVVPVVALTDGARGATVFVEGVRHHVGAMPSREVIDPTGAGDVFAAALGYALATGHAPGDAARLASAEASRVIGDVAANALLAVLEQQHRRRG